MSAEKKKAFSIELVLVIGLPLSAVVAGIITLVIASQSGFSADDAAGRDRFARAVPTAAP